MNGIQAGTMFYFAPAEYMTTRKDFRVVGIEKATKVEPPGPDWELISVAMQDGAVFYFWKRSILTATVVAGAT